MKAETTPQIIPVDAPPLAYSVLGFCEIASISRTQAYKEMKEGRLNFIKCGKRTLIRRKDAEKWLDSLEVNREGV